MIDDIVEFEFEGKRVKVKEILNGLVANPGSLKEKEYCGGYVQKIEKNSDKLEQSKRFKLEAILVTQMTDPSMMEEIRNAKAIVTEIGGLISHAAIVSRELDTLCIIGTKNAMKKIKDGEKIYLQYEVRENDGIEDYVGIIYNEIYN